MDRGGPALPCPVTSPTSQPSAHRGWAGQKVRKCLVCRRPADPGNPCRTRALPMVASSPRGTCQRPVYRWAQRREISRVRTNVAPICLMSLTRETLRARAAEHSSRGETPAKRRLCVRIHVHICMHVHVYMGVSVYVTHIYAYICLCVNLCISVCTRVYVCVYAYTCVCVYV